MSIHDEMVAQVREELADNLRRAHSLLRAYDRAYQQRELVAARNRELLDWLAANDAAREPNPPKPWHEATVGDIWLLKLAGFESAEASPWTVRHSGPGVRGSEFIYPQNGNTMALTDPEIVDARRLWPEHHSAELESPTPKEPQ